MREDSSIGGLPFMKMHGLGNDFVVVDSRGRQRRVTVVLVKALGDRHRGVGFDQLAEITSDDDADARLIFYNADGSLSAACGNATRCIARHIMDETGKKRLTLRTQRGLLKAEDVGEGGTCVNMGLPRFDWTEIPLAREMDTLELPIEGAPTATGMGNPHCTFFVEDISSVDLDAFGPCWERHPLFPERTNVQIAQMIGPDHLRMRVWERGVGITLASGSSSCAAAVAAARRKLTGRLVRVDLDGGSMTADWRKDGVWLTGPSAHVFNGTLTPEFLEGLE